MNPNLLIFRLLQPEHLISGMLIIFFISCRQADSAKEAVSKIDKEKISGAVSCTATGLPVQDSALYMSGGGA